MKTRIIAGLAGAVGLTALIFKGYPELLALAVLLCAALAYIEYDRLFFPTKNVVRQIRLVAMIAATIYSMKAQGLGPLSWIVFWVSFTFLCIGHVLDANRRGDVAAAVRAMGFELLGYVYIVGMFGFLLPIVQSGELGREYLFLLFVVVFGGDTLAYFVGSRFGKHKLAPVISPGKSVEGAVGSVAGALIMTVIWLVVFNHWQDSRFAIKVLLFAPLGSILGQLGDLFESLLKRSQAQKDSGNFLPGHGGILDRLDGLLLVSPIFYFYLTYLLERG